MYRCVVMYVKWFNVADEVFRKDHLFLAGYIYGKELSMEKVRDIVYTKLTSAFPRKVNVEVYAVKWPRTVRGAPVAQAIICRDKCSKTLVYIEALTETTYLIFFRVEDVGSPEEAIAWIKSIEELFMANG